MIEIKIAYCPEKEGCEISVHLTGSVEDLINEEKCVRDAHTEIKKELCHKLLHALQRKQSKPATAGLLGTSPPSTDDDRARKEITL